jgi:3' exoribonuclease, RNase T-like
MSQVHISVDLETLGTLPGCQILSIGAVVFDRTGLKDEFYVALQHGEPQARYGLKTSEATLKWWQSRGEAARAVLSDPSAVELPDGLNRFAVWCHGLGGPKSIYPWGNGADFDNAILHVAFDATSVKLPWVFWNSRCYRTLKNLAGAPELSKRVGTYHNALDDAKTQALHAIEVLNHLNINLG